MVKRISEVITGFVYQNSAWKTRLFNNWDNIIGPLKDRVRIEKIDRNVLILGVVHPAWAQELHFMSDLLKSKINALFDEDYIHTIRFRVITREKIKRNNFDKENQEIIDKENLKNFCLNKKEYKSLSKVKDFDLKCCLKSFYLNCKRWEDEE